jgi:hypothetical protein
MRNTKSDAAQGMFGRSREFGANAMYYTTRLLVFLAVTGGLAAAIVLSLSGELIAHVFA